MKRNLLTLLVVSVFLSACTLLPEAAQGNIRSGNSKVFWIDPVTRQPGGYIVPRTAIQKAKKHNYAGSDASVVISR